MQSTSFGTQLLNFQEKISHLDHLKKIKSTIKSKRINLSFEKPLTRLSKFEKIKLKQIEQENLKLFNKLNEILHSKSDKIGNNKLNLNSLNYFYKKKEISRIQTENFNFLERLKNSKQRIFSLNQSFNEKNKKNERKITNAKILPFVRKIKKKENKNEEKSNFEESFILINKNQPIFIEKENEFKRIKRIKEKIKNNKKLMNFSMEKTNELEKENSYEKNNEFMNLQEKKFSENFVNYLRKIKKKEEITENLKEKNQKSKQICSKNKFNSLIITSDELLKYS